MLSSHPQSLSLFRLETSWTPLRQTLSSVPSTKCPSFHIFAPLKGHASCSEGLCSARERVGGFYSGRAGGGYAPVHHVPGLNTDKGTRVRFTFCRSPHIFRGTIPLLKVPPSTGGTEKSEWFPTPAGKTYRRGMKLLPKFMGSPPKLNPSCVPLSASPVTLSEAKGLCHLERSEGFFAFGSE